MKREPKIIILIFSIIVGVVLSIQFKGQITMYVPVTLESMQDTKNQIDMISKELEELTKMEEDRKERLREIEEVANNPKADLVETMQKDIERNKMFSGNINLEGPGIIISLYDNMEDRGLDYDYDINDDVIHDIDILNIINDLRIAGAEAISINNQRVLSSSEVFCNGPSISINKRRTGTPFIIKAIGDPKLLSAAVNAPGTYGDILKNGLGKGLDTSMEDSLIIQKNSRVINYKFAKPKGEGD